MNQKTSRGHQHADAFMLMRYEGPGGRREWIWNSRDAVTPFCVHSYDDTVELHHGNWHLDRYEPRYIPPIGSRIFVDLTEEIGRRLAAEYVERHWDASDMPMSVHPMFSEIGKDGAIEYFVREWVSAWGGHSPHLVKVTATLHAQFKARAATMEGAR